MNPLLLIGGLVVGLFFLFKRKNGGAVPPGPGPGPGPGPAVPPGPGPGPGPAVPPGPGPGPVVPPGLTTNDLGGYMDEVGLAVEALALDIANDQKMYPAKTAIGQSFLGSWVSFLNQDPYTLKPKALGWWTFYHSERKLIALLGEVSELWVATGLFESQLIKYYDEVVSLGLSPSRTRPKLGYDELAIPPEWRHEHD